MKRNLEHELALTADLAHRDIDVELANARRMAGYMDQVIDALAPSRTQRYVDCLCVRCGAKTTALATSATPGEIRVICADFARDDSDRLGRPDTGWGM